MGTEIITLIHMQDREKSEQVKVHLLKEIRYIPYGIFGLHGKIQKKTLYEWQNFSLGPNYFLGPWWTRFDTCFGALGPVSGESGWFLYNLFK